MSPEQRAKKAVDYFSSELGWVHWDNDQLIPLIATAIREAEDAKLEQAILFCGGEAKAKDLPGDDPRFYAGRREAGRRLVRLVRSLKSQEI
jgi:hypothetical protein